MIFTPTTKALKNLKGAKKEENKIKKIISHNEYSLS